jgi:uncharacterized membrane protein YhaH (DUF805 family)
VTFSEAVRYGFDNYANFSGRSSRRAFWWWFLFGVLVGIAANIIDAIFGSYPVFSGIAGLALLLPDLAFGVRRLHDTNRTGWWLLIALIPIIGFIVLLIFYLEQGDEGENEYGPPPAEGSVAPATA